jgi:hypothetical protein
MSWALWGTGIIRLPKTKASWCPRQGRLLMLLTRGREEDVNQVDSAAPRIYKNLAL